MTAIDEVTGKEECYRTVEESDRAICTVLGLEGDRKEADRIIKNQKCS